MKYSPQQLEVFRILKGTSHNILISATAGSGKTTTIVEALKLLPRFRRTLFTAFNKSIAEELAKRTPEHVHVSTLHSLGMTILGRNLRVNLKLNEWKTLKFIMPLLDQWGIKKEKRDGYKMLMMELVNYGRITYCPLNPQALYKLSMKHDLGVMIEDCERALEVIDHLNIYNSHHGHDGKMEIDYIDMIYLPVHLKLLKEEYDYVFVDECQDLNECQKRLIFGVLKSSGRWVMVGDRSQSIYGFAGADTESFDQLKSLPNTVVLPLSVSYRCAKSIVQLAKKVNSEIEPYELNPDGLVVGIGAVDSIQEGDYVLCRNTKPLVQLYFHLLLQNKKSHILGKDLGGKLNEILDSLGGKLTYNNHLDLFNQTLQEQLEILEKKGISKPKYHPSYTTLKENLDILKFLIEKTKSIEKPRVMIEMMFDDSVGSITLMTIHKSKGLENDRVFLLEPQLIPSKYAIQAWQLTQEKNLRFVAFTRAKTELHFIKLPKALAS